MFRTAAVTSVVTSGCRHMELLRRAARQGCSRIQLVISSCFSAVVPLQASALRRLAPLGDRVLVKRVVQEAKTAGGIFLPDTGKKLNEGEVRGNSFGALLRWRAVRSPWLADRGRIVCPPRA